jgi:DNA polymerase-1
MDTEEVLKYTTTVDFETEAIGRRPDQYPPKPVGVAIRWPKGDAEYLAWGHPSGNNCTYEDARRAVMLAYQGPVLFHNAAFDLEVAYQHLKLPFPDEWHDTLFLLFLNNPHAATFALKPSAALLLNQPPEEQDALRSWITANVPGATGKNFGAFISKAPVEIVGPYAIGDVRRTFDLFRLLLPPVATMQLAPYNREKLLMPYLLDAERRGIPVNRDLLNQWAHALDSAVVRSDRLIQTRLNAPNLNIDSNDELADALAREGLVSHWILTDGTKITLDGKPMESELSGAFGEPTAESPFPVEDFGGPTFRITNGNRSMAKGVLPKIITHPEVVNEIIYRNTAATMLRTFVSPWLDLSTTDGRLHTKWHQVRGMEKNGTKTGRVASSDPNLANVMNPSGITPPFGLPFLPALRSALLPEPGCVWLSADYSQQELRIAGHMEDGDIQRAYRETPNLDLHDFARRLIAERTGLIVDRKKTKTVAFATIYGAGVNQLAAQMGVSANEAYAVRAAYFAALPGLLQLSERVRDMGRSYGRVKSLGGRMIPLEMPRMVKGRMQTFEYKLLNHLVQGSAADQTKQAIIDFCRQTTGCPFSSQVYDEVNISVPNDPKTIAMAAKTLTNSMVNALPIDVPMLVDVEVGPSWGELSPYIPESNP